jgi:hypothetical protein
MISNKEKENAALWINTIKDLSTKEQKAKCKELIVELKNKFAISTTRSILTHYRKLAKKALLNISDNLAISKADNNKIERAYEHTIAKRRHAVVIDGKLGGLKQINDLEGLLSVAIDTLENSTNPYELTAAVAIMSGRRMVEVVKVGRFFNHNYTKYQLNFGGQAKTKTKETGKYVIPTLCDKELIKKAVKLIREKLQPENLTNEQVARKFETSVNMAVNKMFSKFLGRCTCHTLRKAYATICEYKYKTKYDDSYAYFSRILGYSVEDRTTAASYRYFVI